MSVSSLNQSSGQSFIFLFVHHLFLSVSIVFLLLSPFFSLLFSSFKFTRHPSSLGFLCSSLFPSLFPSVMSGVDQDSSSPSDSSLVRSGSGSGSSFNPPPASSSSYQPSPLVYCVDPNTVTIKKGALVDVNALWTKLYDICLSGGTVGDFQQALRLLSQGEGGMHGARILASMDANLHVCIPLVFGRSGR